MGDFEDISEPAGVRDGRWTWGACFEDFEIYGNPDIFLNNGFEEAVREQARLLMASDPKTRYEEAEDRGITPDEQGRPDVCTDHNDDGTSTS